MAYSVELTPAALSGLERLSPKHQERLLRKVRWLTDNFDQLSPTPLTGDLSGLFKLRVGDYRVLYSFNADTEIITVHQIGHRREIYL
jgi:mRNA interferase RelE/StbE